MAGRPSAVRQSIQLGRVQETALIPLYGRALESRKKRPILEDPRAIEIVDSIDWDFSRFGQRRRVVGCALRSAMFDVWVREFIRQHPDGVVVEIGAGLNTRFERLDNGRVHWYDLELADMAQLRRRFFPDTERRRLLASSVVSPDWIASVRQSPGPYYLVAETVFPYLQEAEVRDALRGSRADFRKSRSHSTRWGAGRWIAGIGISCGEKWRLGSNGSAKILWRFKSGTSACASWNRGRWRMSPSACCPACLCRYG
ncbi:MAG: class I SAM-dependent methyltransferase [Ignavibacteriota bacterium]